MGIYKAQEIAIKNKEKSGESLTSLFAHFENAEALFFLHEVGWL